MQRQMSAHQQYDDSPGLTVTVEQPTQTVTW